MFAIGVVRELRGDNLDEELTRLLDSAGGGATGGSDGPPKRGMLGWNKWED
jgi:hypothetical protein